VTAIPAVGPLPVVSLPDVSDATTSQGLRVVAVRRPNVPLVQLRLIVPLGKLALRDLVPLRLLPKMLFSGTGERSASQVASTLQRLGMLAGAGADVDFVSVSAGVPVDVLREALGQIVDIVAHPSFPQREVVGERERTVQEVIQEAVDPIAIATHALTARLFPRHPYADPLPDIGAVRRVGRKRLVEFHAERVGPNESLLVAVGDLDAESMASVVERVVENSWMPSPDTGPQGRPDVPPPAPPRPGVTIVHRPGAVQSNLRLGTRCPDRRDAEFPALFLAATVFGGTFTSRLVDNLRERHGYTYTPRAGIDEHRLASAFSVKAEVGTEVTAAALAEVQYELARMATTEPTADELNAARRYVTGLLAMGAATQAGLAGLLGGLLAQGLEPSYLERFSHELAVVDAGDVASAAARFLGPAAMTTVVVGDADVIAARLRPLGGVSVEEGRELPADS
jgi:zinc protease